MFNTWNNWWFPNNPTGTNTKSGFTYGNTNFVNEANYKKPIKITKSIEDPNKPTNTSKESDEEIPPKE